MTLASGLQYKVLTKGEGQHHPTADSPCDCHYKGTLTDGTEFDSSYKRGEPTSFAPNQVIKGWTEAMQLMVEGDKWEMYIPSELGYGDGGSGAKIKGGDVLIFRMEILKIKGNKVPADRCDPATLAGCSDKAKDFIKKEKWADVANVAAEIKRLEGMQSGKMAPDAEKWLQARLRILNKLQA